MSTVRIVGMLTVLCANIFAADINLWVDDSAGVIGLVDVTPGPNLGKVTLVGPSGVVLTDIAFDASGHLFGIGPLSSGPFNLYSLNTTTGTASIVGALNPPVSAVPCGSATCPPNALVFSGSGTLYTATNSLYTINPVTAADTLVGPLGGGFVSGGDLAFANGKMFLATSNNSLVTVNPTTGAATLVGPMGVASMFGLASPDNATLYGVAGTSVYILDQTTGNATLLVNYGGHGLGQAFGEAFFTEATSTVPEPSSFILVGAGLLAWRMRRRIRRSA